MFVFPMLLNKEDKPFDNEQFITELKLDGIRLILAKFDNKVKLYTRHRNDVTMKFPELHNIDIPNGTIIDGEIIVPGPNGKPDFEAMMSRFHSKNSLHSIQYAVFDVMYYKGEKVTSLPLYERKELLSSFLPVSEHVISVQWIYGNGITYFNLVKQNELEGIVLKKSDSPYQINKRSSHWLKVINYQFEDVSIIGLRKKEFGLLLGKLDGNKVEPVGIMEFMTPAAKKLLYKNYPKWVTKENKQFIYIDPDKVKCQVKFRNYTKNGKLHIPSFVKYVS
ncbi:DNA ligase-1 [Gracilibacillus ureilyticus]|uniref:DNA ligase-1 n=1 Tax=Gracilibacillus ureilyticus TaxID=531814 RepID=A0A1H9MN57_9BACI|nr:RNA ligase family protein [Gracilibacillus ureilyticus]SER25001.1 DNA ligase-1 [Gracilibacillus ureilyticus]